MASINDLDREVVRGDKMDIATVRRIMDELGAADYPRPDYDRIRGELFPKRKKRRVTINLCFWRMRPAYAVVAVSLFVVMFFGTSVLAFQFIRGWVSDGYAERITAERNVVFESVGAAEAFIGMDLRVPREFPAGFMVSIIQDVDFGIFRALVISFEGGMDVLNLAVVYEYTDAETVRIVPHDIATTANYRINGLDVLYLYNEGPSSAFWELDGIMYRLSGAFTLEDLEAVIYSIP